MRLKAFFFFSFVICSNLLLSAPPAMTLAPGEGQLIVHNRILAKVNGKSISVMDVRKKMDVFLSEHYPEVMDSPATKYQFYSTQWKTTLNQLIDSELISADAEKLDLKVTDAEVREKIHERFGPNVIKTLDKLNLSYEEAKKMVRDDLIVQRMNWVRIYSKAQQNINPIDVKKAYQEYCAKNPASEEWKYEVLSVKSKDKELGSSTISHAASLIAQSQAGLKAAADNIKQTLASRELNPDTVVVQVSDVIKTDSKNISEAHLKAIHHLTPGEYSEPVSQVNRITNEVVHRIFHLLEHTRKEVPSFKTLADNLQDRLFQQEAAKINRQYISKLRKKFGYDEKHIEEMIPSDFQPFALSS